MHGIGVDIGGSHISAARIDLDRYERVSPIFENAIAAGASSGSALDSWAACIAEAMEGDGAPLECVGIAMPGPLDYAKGVCRIKGLNKYDSLFGLNLARALRNRLGRNDLDIRFINDAAAFALGEYHATEIRSRSRVVAITLGTGLGSGFVDEGRLVTNAPGVPPEGYLY